MERLNLELNLRPMQQNSTDWVDARPDTFCHSHRHDHVIADQQHLCQELALIPSTEPHLICVHELIRRKFYSSNRTSDLSKKKRWLFRIGSTCIFFDVVTDTCAVF